MKELLLKRKVKFTLYILACFLPVIDQLMANYAFALLIGSVEIGEMDYFIKVIILTGVFALLGTVLYIISRFMRISYMRDTILDVRINAFDKILKHSYDSFSRKSKDVYVSNLINDVNIFEQNFFLRLINILFNGGHYLVSISILLYLDFKFGMALVFISFLMFIISRRFQKKTVGLQEDVSANNENFTLNIANTLNGLEILKLNNIEDKFLYKSLKSIDKVERKKFHYTVFTDGQRSLNQSLGFVIFIGILMYLLSLIFKGVSLTRIIFMLQLSNGCIWPIGQIVSLMNELKASIKIYDKITKSEEPVYKSKVKHQSFSFNSMINIKNLNFSYDDRIIIKNATFTIEKGKKYLIKGPSGAGKSTLIRLLSMSYPQYQGSITLDDVDFSEINEESFYSNVSFIYQDVFLFEDTILNNITLFKDIPQEQVLQACHKAGLDDFLNERPLGLQELLMENGKNLSGGQRQRLSIARAIAKNSSILFVDEGTSSLNEELGRTIEDTILSLDSTVVAISHRYYEGITEKYDYVLELKNGIIHQYNSWDYFREVVTI